MNIDYDRNTELEHSLKTGTKAFAVGAVLLLVLSIAGMPEPLSGDALLGASSMVTAGGGGAVTTSAGPGENAGTDDATRAPSRIEAPFTSTQRDVEDLPAQF